MAEAKNSFRTRINLKARDRERAVLASRLSKISGELTRSQNDAAHYRAERDAAQANTKKAMAQLTKQQWLVSGLEQARDRQLEDTAAAESVIVSLASEVQKSWQEVRSERRRAAVAACKEGVASSLLQSLQKEHDALYNRLQQEQTKVAAAEAETAEARLRVAALEPVVQQHHHSLVDASATIAKLTQELMSARAESARLQKRCEELQAEARHQQQAAADSDHQVSRCNENIAALTLKLQQEQERGRTLASRCVRGQDEAQALQESTRLLQHQLQRGDQQHRSTARCVFFLSNEVNNLRDQLTQLSRQAELNRALKTELTRMQRQLIASQHKRAALETHAMTARASRHGSLMLRADDSAAAEEARVLQRQLLQAAEAQAAARLQLHGLKRQVANLQRAATRSRDDGASCSRGRHLNQLRAAHAHIQAAQGVANWAIKAREEAQLDNKKLREALMMRAHARSSNDKRI